MSDLPHPYADPLGYLAASSLERHKAADINTRFGVRKRLALQARPDFGAQLRGRLVPPREIGPPEIA